MKKESIKSKSSSTPSNFSSGYGTDKDRVFSTQYQQVRASFSERPKTMLMVAVDTGIERANICRYKAKMMKRNEILFVKNGICEVSKHGAVYYKAEKGGTK